jgi:rhamnosyltransferase
MKKNLGIYITYDSEGAIDEYIIYCLKEYRELVDELIVVSNHSLSIESRKKLLFVDKIYERDNEGYDVGAIADTLTNLYGWENVLRFDEVYIMNDSVFGPLYSLEPIINEMDSRTDIDFWGLTPRGESDFDGGEKIYPAHIQLYFYAVESKMLHSVEFKDYWEEITKYITDFRSAITNYEFEFTHHFEKLGFKWDVAVRLPGYNTDNPHLNLSPYHYNSYDLVTSGKYPFVKRKLFTGDFIYSKYSDKSDLRRTFDYIASETHYDVNLIWDYILRKYALSDIMRSLCLCEVIPCMRYVNRKLSASGKYKIIGASKYGTVSIDNCVEEYILLSLDEKDEGDTEALWKSKCFCVNQNLMCNEQYIGEIINLFEENPRLGVLIPPFSYYGMVTEVLSQTWHDKNKAKGIYEVLKLSVPFSETKAPIYTVNALWCRKDILNYMDNAGVLQNIDETILQLIPLVAQNLGYYTEIVENMDYVKYQQFGGFEVSQNLLGLSDLDISRNMTLEECENQTMLRKVQTALGQHRQIYIYGAGERAFRLISAVESQVDVKGIIVSSTQGNPSKLQGYGVCSINDLDMGDNDTLVVITVGEKNRKSVVENLKRVGWRNYIFV